MIIAALACFLLLIIAWVAAPTRPEPAPELVGEVQMSEVLA